MRENLFPRRSKSNPRIYAYCDSHPQYKGMLKIGYTTKSVQERVKEQYPTLTPGDPTYSILLDESAINSDGSTFTDKDVHKYLKKRGYHKVKGEWFLCNVNDVKTAIKSISSGETFIEGRPYDFEMRPEQKEAVYSPHPQVYEQIQ